MNKKFKRVSSSGFVPQRQTSKFVSLLSIMTILMGAMVSSGSLVYVAYASPGSTAYLEEGVYPGAPAYTVYREDSTYYGKDANGHIVYQGSNATQIAQNTIDDVNSVGGGWVVFKQGTYSFPTSLIGKDNVNIWLDDVELLAVNSIANFLQWRGVDNSTIAGKGIINCDEKATRGIIIDSSGTDTPSRVHILAQEIRFAGFTDTGLWIEDLYLGTFENLWFAGSTSPSSYNIGIKIIGYSQLITLRNVVVDTCGHVIDTTLYPAFWVEGPALYDLKDLTIDNLKVMNRRGAVISNAERIQISNSKFIDNDYYSGVGSDADGLDLISVREVSVCNSYFNANNGSGLCIGSNYGAYDVQVINCYAKNNGGAGFTTEPEIDGSTRSYRVTYSNCHATNNGQDGSGGKYDSGFLIEFANQTKLIGNTAVDTQGSPTQDYGIYINSDADRVLYDGNICLDNASGQISDNGSNSKAGDNITT